MTWPSFPSGSDCNGGSIDPADELKKCPFLGNVALLGGPEGCVKLCSPSILPEKELWVDLLNMFAFDRVPEPLALQEYSKT